MRTPARKPGKYAHAKPDPYITQEKLEKLKANLKRLKSNQPSLIAEVKRLAADGDFSENAAYQIAKGRLRGLNQRILDIEDHLKQAIVIQPQKGSRVVRLGSVVSVEIEKKIKTYQILGSTETDPKKNIISRNSPIGSGLMGHRLGDTVKIKLAKGEVEYKITNIE